MLFVLPLLLFTATAPPVTTVSGDTVCTLHHALQRRQATWTPAECDRVADALNATFNPRLVLAIAIIESDLRANAKAHPRRNVYDAGLMGIRCHVSAGRCRNWPVRGRTLRDLLDPVVSIEAAERILKRKRKRSPRHWLRHYNGGTREHGYAESVRVIKAATVGHHLYSSLPRTRKLAKRVIKALKTQGAEHEHSTD